MNVDRRHHHHQSQGRGPFSAVRRPQAFRCLVTHRAKRLQRSLLGAILGAAGSRRSGGGHSIICGRSISRGFNPKAPPPRTQAFYEMVNAMRSEKESEMEDILDHLDRPAALIIGQIVSPGAHPWPP